MTTVIECKNIRKIYTEGPQDVEVLKGVSLQIEAGEQVAIVGSSGSGKTTLLNMLGGLDLPSSGQVLVAGKNLATVNETVRGQLRNKYLGFVYQFHHLLNEFTAAENVAMPLIIRRLGYKKACQKATTILKQIGLQDRLSHFPSMLSGGEKQRVAIARALVTNPCLVLADEPTGNLDTDNAADVFGLLMERVKISNAALVVVTHDLKLAKKCDKIISLD